MNRQGKLNEGIKALAEARKQMEIVRGLIAQGREEAKAHKDERYPVLVQMDRKALKALDAIEAICSLSFDLQGDDISVFTGGGGK